MLWVIYQREEHYSNDRGKELSRMVLEAVHRFQDGDAAMKRFVWSHEQLGMAATREGLKMIMDGRYHVFTTAHTMPEHMMMSAMGGFKLMLHQVRDEEDFIKEWHMAPGREEIMTAIEYDAKKD